MTIDDPRDPVATARHNLARGTPAVIVRVAATKGSAPRESDALMAVTHDSSAGTIGGGQLEWLAIAHARKILSGKAAPGDIAGETPRDIDVALGPEIGQCCGGRVRLEFRLADAGLLDRLAAAQARRTELRPQVLIFGAGHTGRALAQAMAPLPLRVMLVDERPDTLADLPQGVDAIAAVLPESQVAAAAPASAFVAMTHLHSLDFQIVAAALKRGDAAYCGMIGSKTKRAVFESWFADQGFDRALAASLACPIGGNAVADKRPEVIAAMTAAEILAALYSAASNHGSG